MEIRNPALVIRRVPYGETSLIVWLFTPDYGMINGMAKGIRRSRQPERALLAGFHTLNVLCRLRSPTTMAYLGEMAMGRARHLLPSLTVAMAGAQVLYEVVYRFAPPHDPQPRLFARLEAALDALEANRDPLRETALALVDFLTLLGFGWQVEGCAGCGGQEALGFFSPRRGMLVCRTCGAPHASRLIPLTPGLLALLQATNREVAPEAGDPAAWGGLYRLGVEALVWHGGHALAADGFFRLLLDLPKPTAI